MKAYERTQLLDRIDRESATVGVQIPERIRVDGDPVHLREFVLEIGRRETIPPGQRERVERAKRNLRRERLRRIDRLETEPMTREEGEELVESVIGIDRALTALEQLDPPDLEGEIARKEAADQKRWMSFLEQALGNDTDGRQRRR